MPVEPNRESRQKAAFDFLRTEARDAHLEGDGLKVASLCQSALQELSRLVEADQLLLPLREVQWIFVFQLFWLLTQHDIDLSEIAIQKLPRRSPDDHEVAKILECYHFLVKEPLDSRDSAVQRIEALPISGFGAVAQPESVELVRHLIELSWFRSPATDRWSKLIDKWIGSGILWISEALTGMKERLSAQVRLTVPDTAHPLFEENSACRLRELSPLAELWLFHVHGRAQKVMEEVERLSVSISMNSYEWRQVADYWYTNHQPSRRQNDLRQKTEIAATTSITIKSGTQDRWKVPSGTLPTNAEVPDFEYDSPPVWLARRRMMSLEYPLLAFLDRRESRLQDLLREIFRKHSKVGASVRFEVWQLAMLQELAALRLWDFGMWREAIHAQSEVFLEASQWPDTKTVIAVQGLTLAVRSLAALHPKNDKFTRDALKKLEFTDEQLCSEFTQTLIQTYPRQKYIAAELLESFGDLIPPSQWLALAKWTVKFSDESREWRSTGMKINPLSHLRTLLPQILETSPIWGILASEVSRLAALSYAWRGGDMRAVLRAWLVWSPLDQCLRTANEMAIVETQDLAERLARSELFIEAEAARSNLERRLTRPLLIHAKDLVERFMLLDHIAPQDAAALQPELKSRVCLGIRAAIARAAPSDQQQEYSFGPFPAGIGEVKSWTVEDFPLLDELVAAIESPNVHREWLWWLINTLQLIVADGTIELANRVRPAIVRWLMRLPEGRTVGFADSGPFSRIQSSGTSGGEIAFGIGWLVFQLFRKLDEENRDLMLRWIKTMLLSGEAEPLSIAFYGSLIVAGRSSGHEQDNALAYADTILLNLSTRLATDSKAAEALSSGIRYTASILIAPASGLVDWTTEPGTRVLRRVTQMLESFMPRLALAPEGAIRSAIGLLLWNLKQWQPLTEPLSTIHSKLTVDSRATVRTAANGGWEVELKRRASALPLAN